MDEEEFQRLLDLFPIVRPRDFHVKKWQDAWQEGNEGETENRAVDPNDAFWKKLKLAAEKKTCAGRIINHFCNGWYDERVKVGAAEAERFCRAFQQVHSKLVHEELSLDAARRFMSLSKGYGK